MRIVKLDSQAKQNILSDLLKRDPNQYGEYAGTVQEIVEDVKKRGDEALFEYTRKFDHAEITPENIQVTEEEIREAMESVDEKLLKVMKKSMANIRDHHERQKRQSWFESRPDGTILGQKITALESAGVYVPGGKAAYPSSVLMNIIPAKVAGVGRIAMVTPPGKDGKVNPVTLTAAHLAGATEVYKVGGAQAIAALAFGTESIPRVNKIVGPGNIFVALAKKAVYGHVSIDSIAGPSEILVIADDSARPALPGRARRAGQRDSGDYQPGIGEEGLRGSGFFPSDSVQTGYSGKVSGSLRIYPGSRYSGRGRRHSQ